MLDKFDKELYCIKEDYGNNEGSIKEMKMKFLFNKLVYMFSTLMLLLGFSDIRAQQPDPTTEDSVRIALQFFRDRFNVRDVEGLLNYATDSMNEYPQPLIEIIIADLKEINALIPPATHLFFDESQSTIEVHNENNATMQGWFIFRAKTHVPEAGIIAHKGGQITVTFVKKNAQWKIANFRGFVNRIKNILNN